MSPLDDAMRDFAVNKLEKEASYTINICDEHDWHYNKQSDEVYCVACGSLNGEYKGMGFMLMEIHRMLKEK